MSISSLRIEEGLEQPLEAMSQAMQRSKNWIINEALRQYLTNKILEEQRWQETLEALEDVRMGRVVDGDKVHAWLDSWSTENKLPMPLPSS